MKNEVGFYLNFFLFNFLLTDGLFGARVRGLRGAIGCDCCGCGGRRGQRLRVLLSLLPALLGRRGTHARSFERLTFAPGRGNECGGRVLLLVSEPARAAS